ncbi:hypothetical protein CEXT_260881 [Caerostris extrusa]|uniref:Uncharacterized protein n=1 Tax=Caerostris extrusa TaxID=172846 RepID=A0AAV4WKI6_CAEEX|nr:hypothetical protein CEXT_260881 [Caerostris extrusa]
MCKILKSFSVVPVCVPAREGERKNYFLPLRRDRCAKSSKASLSYQCVSLRERKGKKNYFLPLRVRYMEKEALYAEKRDRCAKSSKASLSYQCVSLRERKKKLFSSSQS